MSNIKDLTGLTFGRLTVLCEYGKNKYYNRMWLCECSCGNFKVIVGKSLIKGVTKSCGCLHSENISKKFKRDMVGKKFGRLLVVSEEGKNKHGRTLWGCKCDCGNKKLIIVSGNDLRSGNSKSCGCLQKEATIKRNKQKVGENHPRWKGGFIESKCIVCGKQYLCREGAIQNGRQFCSYKCRDEYYTGENHPNWKGGVRYGDYCNKFNNHLKEKVRNKFDNRCIICGKTKEQNKNKNMCVHHVDHNKDQGCNGTPWELVPLCNSCHGKVHGKTNEDYYKKLIRNILSWRVLTQ